MTKAVFHEALPAGTIGEADDGTFPIVVMTPGQGSTAYYREDVIRRDITAALPAGTHVYLDHLKKGETRSAERLLGYLTEDTSVDEQGRAINRFKPLSKHREWIEEIRHLVGLSISIAGDGRRGEVDGRQTIIAEAFIPAITNSVDVVPYAGRGGAFLESYLEEANAEEGNRTLTESEAGATEGNESIMADIDKADFDALVESVKELVATITARESAEAAAADEAPDAEADRSAAVDAVAEVHAAEGLTESVKTRLLEQIKAGDYDIAEAIEADRQYREEVAASLAESASFVEAGASAAGGSDNSDNYTVKGWGA